MRPRGRAGAELPRDNSVCVATAKAAAGLRTPKKTAATWLGGGVAGVGSQRINCLSSFRRDGDARVEEFGEDFDAGDQAGAGARKVAVGVHVVNVVVANGGQFGAFARKSEGAVLGGPLNRM